MKQLLSSLIVLILSFLGTSQCNYTLEMSDAFGDSWQGGFISVSVNGVPTFGPYAAQGVFSTESFSVNYLDLVSIEYTAGVFESDNSYVLLEGGTSIFFDGPTPGVGVVFGTTCTTCSTAPSIDVQTACDSLIWIDGITYYASNSTATQLLTNAMGCDSLVELDLTIGSVNLVVTNASPALLSNQIGGSYQWLNCDSSYSIIPGATDQAYLAVLDGNFAVEVSMNGCTDTSACEIVNNAGIDHLDMGLLNIFPNPSDGHFTILFEGELKSVQVFDLMGREVLVSVNLSTGFIDASNLESGKYLVKIDAGAHLFLEQLVIFGE